MLTPSQIEDLRFKYGIKGSSVSQPKESVTSRVLSDIPSDIGETAVGVGKQVTEAGKNIAERVTSDQPMIDKVVGTGADLFRGIGRTIGEVFVGGAKALATPELEQATKEKVGEVAGKVIGSDIGQDVISRYESLSQDMKSQVDNILGYTEGLTSLIGGGKVLPSVSKKIGGVADDALTSAREASKEILSGITKRGGEGILEANAKGLKSADIMQRVARIPKTRQAKFKELAGEDVGEYLVKRGIFGDVDEISEKLYKNFTTSKGTVDDTMSKLPGVYKARQIETALDELFQKETRISTPGALSKDFTRVRELRNKYMKEGLSMSEINEVKRMYERNVRLDFVKENAPEGVKRATEIDNAIRSWQYKKAEELGFKDLRALNKETQLAKQLLDDLGKEASGSLGNNAITLTDWIMISGGDPAAVAGFFAKKVLSSKKVMSKVAEKLAPESTFELPKGEIGEPVLDGYLKFLESTAGRATP